MGLVNRDGWPAGPWDDEPDFVEFEHVGFQCMIMRGPLGAWCGYAAVTNEHPAYGKGRLEVDIAVHGGLTLANGERPGKGGEDAWWFGFDCGHAWDITPALMGFPQLRDIFESLGRLDGIQATYRDMAYAIQETERMAEQLAEQLAGMHKKDTSKGRYNQVGFGIGEGYD